ncbi:MAG TPA: chemotaxis protein CheW [Usitatibacter sp.]|jgi:purine-binding chemotaxis protein CheW|nr:chemotaxis protein CheW [Usitatibacter sp.]
MESRAAVREATREVLVFVIGKEEYGVDILKVQEIRGYEKVTAIPASPAYLKGVVNLRGVIVPVVDMRVKFGMADPSYDSFTVVVILKLASRVIGIVVDAVSDVARLAASDVKEAPRLGGVVDSAFITGVATQGDRMVLLLDIEKFLSSGELDLLDGVAREKQA